MATGDISSVTIRSDGWSADVKILGFTTGETFAFGTVPGSAKFVVSVQTSGFDDSKTPTNPVRTIYGTKAVRKAYPSDASIDETVSGSDIIVRVALSSRVRSGDAVLVSVAAGCFINTGGSAQTSNAVTNLAATNSSTLTHPTPFGQWAQRPYDRWQSNPMLSVTARHMYGIAAVDIILSDAHSHTVTTVATKQSNKRSLTGLYAEEWTATCDLSTLTQGDAITARYKLYPKIGDTATDSNSTTVNADNTILGTCNYTYMNDKNGTMDVYAVVQSGGSDITGVSSATFGIAVASPYASIAKAITDGTANVILVRPGGSTSVLGGAGVTPPSSLGYWRQVKPYPATGPFAIEVDGTQHYGTPHLSYENFIIQQSGSGNNWFDGDNGDNWLSFLNCTTDANGQSTTLVSNFAYRSNGVFIVGCTIDDAYAFGLENDFAARLCHWFDGCLINTSSGGPSASIYRFIGCTAFGFGVQSSDSGSTTGPLSDPWFVEYNQFFKYTPANAIVSAFGGSTNSSVGISLVGNVLERSSGTNPVVQLSADSETNTLAHCVVWHNTCAGERFNAFYNETGTTARLKNNVSVIGNAFGTSWNIKADLFGIPNGNRVGNWAELYGVDYVGNCSASTLSFDNEYTGINSLQGSATMAFTADASVTGTGLGNGNYLPGVGSDLLNRIPSGYEDVSHDLLGRMINNIGTAAAGALQSSSANPISITRVTAKTGDTYAEFYFATSQTPNISDVTVIKIIDGNGTQSGTSIITQSAGYAKIGFTTLSSPVTWDITNSNAFGWANSADTTPTSGNVNTGSVSGSVDVFNITIDPSKNFNRGTVYTEGGGYSASIDGGQDTTSIPNFRVNSDLKSHRGF